MLAQSAFARRRPCPRPPQASCCARNSGHSSARTLRGCARGWTRPLADPPSRGRPSELSVQSAAAIRASHMTCSHGVRAIPAIRRRAQASTHRVPRVETQRHGSRVRQQIRSCRESTPYDSCSTSGSNSDRRQNRAGTPGRSSCDPSGRQPLGGRNGRVTSAEPHSVSPAALFPQHGARMGRRVFRAVRPSSGAKAQTALRSVAREQSRGCRSLQRRPGPRRLGPSLGA
jgi:hypothetical protein